MSRQFRQYAYFIVTLLAGFAVSVLLYFNQLHLARQFEADKFHQLASDRFVAIEHQIEYSFSVLSALKAFFQASHNVDRNEFRIFTSGLLLLHPEILAAEWIPGIPAGQRARFEKQIRDEGFPGFAFTELDANNKLTTAGHRARYFPVVYVEPLAFNRDALGFDLGSSPARLAALKEAILSHRTVITEPITLIQEQDGNPSILALQQYNPPEFSQRKNADPAFVLIVIRMKQFYTLLSAQSSLPESLLVSIRDKTSNRLLAGSQPRDQLYDNGHWTESTIDVGGRQWVMTAYAPDAFLGSLGQQATTRILLLGFLSSFFLALFTQSLASKRQHIKAEVRTRTRELNEITARFQSVVDTAADAIISVSDKGIISRFNSSAEALFGYRGTEVIGRNISLLMPANHAEIHDSYIDNYLQTGIRKIIGNSREEYALHKDGHRIPVLLSISDTGIEGEMRFTGIIRDLSEIRAAEEELRKQKNHLEQSVAERTAELTEANHKLRQLSEIDPLTRIPNRRFYDQRLTAEVATARRTGQPLALLMLDIDKFKEYNDNYGHDMGDMILRRIAETISETLPRATDTVSRYGGEEFVVLLPTTDIQGAWIIAERIRTRIRHLAIPDMHPDSGNILTISVGIASLKGNDLNETDLLHQADSALYTAKRGGRNQSVAYSTEKGEP